ncbi:NmrA family NAD(P)-binding protein [Aquimarina longa]|uniref:NmrA family NAD(P)-binding protein n=1 Tax=Aquimarina longa TaxID=1080221 RepID=UPI0007814A52|nr:NmrA family NAD(P)-binding protein [Aquimarina longa]
MKKHYKKTIAVFGCTGTVGTYVLKELLHKNCEVRGVLSSPQRKPTVTTSNFFNLSYISANIENKEEVEKACICVDTVFLLTATHPNQIENEKRIIDAAKQKGVQQIVKLSAPEINPIELVEVAKWHKEIEYYLQQSAIEFCCIKPYAFMQNLERNTVTIKRFKKIIGSMDDAPRNYVDARDVAEVAVHYLLSDTLNNEFITISGPEAVTYTDIAKKLSYVTNTSIRYYNVSKEEHLTMLIKRAKLPHWLANHIIELDNLAKKIPELEKSNITSLLGKHPRVLDTYLLENKHKFIRKPIWKYF